MFDFLPLILIFTVSSLLFIWMEKRLFNKYEGSPRLKYFPEKGFNIEIKSPSTRTNIFELKYKLMSIIQYKKPSINNSLVSGEEIIALQKDFILISDKVKIILSFRLEKKKEKIHLIYINEFVNEEMTVDLDDVDYINCKYAVRKGSWFYNNDHTESEDFDGRAIKITNSDLKEYYEIIEADNNEQEMDLHDVSSVENLKSVFQSAFS